MLNFFLAFIYADRPYYDKDRILCMAQYLFEVQEKNRLEQKGLLKRFSINCYGNTSENLETIRAVKAEKFKELKGKKGTKEYEEYFLRYTPGDKNVKGRKTEDKKMKTVKKEKEPILKNNTIKNNTIKNNTIKNKKHNFKSEKRMKKKRTRKYRNNDFLF